MYIPVKKEYLHLIEYNFQHLLVKQRGRNILSYDHILGSCAVPEFAVENIEETTLINDYYYKPLDQVIIIYILKY